ncbi:hypothetical protein N399_04360 [Bacillus licheniformis CG-B52]|nr:hypothetical protein N399_04360 [Bacillus licheniformis CG-B52]
MPPEYVEKALVAPSLFYICRIYRWFALLMSMAEENRIILRTNIAGIVTGKAGKT